MEKITTYQYENGLTLIHVYKPNFTKKFASVCFQYGSKHNLNDDVPLGIAHFLEHKMFEKYDGDYLHEFAKLGSHVNAFTSFNETVYYFTTTLNFEESFLLLLDLVTKLEISDDSVKKEQDIILQELSMYDSDPETVMFHKLFQNMYENTPIKNNILGTEKSISDISANHLYDIYNKYYTPQNTVITVVGDIDFEHIKLTINNHALMNKENSIIHNKMISEKSEVVIEKDEINLDVASDKVLLGYKLNILPKDKKIMYDVALKLLLTKVLTPLNSDYQKWLDDKKINDYFGYFVDIHDLHSMLVLYAESSDSEFLSSLMQYIIDFKMTEQDLNQIKKRMCSFEMRLKERFDKLSFQLMRYQFEKLPFNYFSELLKSITLKHICEAQQYLKQHSISKLYVKKR